MPPPETTAPEAKKPKTNQESQSNLLFIELFAGEARLTQAVWEVHIDVAVPQEIDNGDTDFTKEEQVSQLIDTWTKWKQQGYHLVFHAAPPCASFSRARDRSLKTKLRSKQQPESIDNTEPRTAVGNQIARQCARAVKYLVDVLEADGTWEQPLGSYMMPFLEKDGAFKGTPYQKLVFHQCMFGTKYKKPTAMYCFGSFCPKNLAKSCCWSWENHLFSCGQWEHEILGFGQNPTGPAATYPWGFCRAYAGELDKFSRTRSSIDRVNLHTDGKVRRHQDRGETDWSQKEIKEAEDAVASAGARNPHWVIQEWPEYCEAMRPVSEVLLNAIRQEPDLSCMYLACGPNPVRPPPAEHTVQEARARLASKLSLSTAEAEAHHESSTWRYNIIGQIQRAAGDPDVHVASWLRDGAPMGIAKAIPAGGLLPLVHEQRQQHYNELEQSGLWHHNHPSFDTAEESFKAAHAQMKEHLDQGFAWLFRDREQAERWLECTAFASPLADVMKPKADGTIKHRLIQDLKASGINACSTVPERQVLPRFQDHGRDLADLSVLGKTQVLVLDYQHAFMSVPLAYEELRFNCSAVPNGVARSRKSSYPGEPEKGTFVIWRVLGFGGHAGPLVYSRIATMASRSTQALLNCTATEARQARLQLYVDDPIVVASGSDADRQEQLDLAILWWLIMGIPLSWKKGCWSSTDETYRWIGVDFKLINPGVAQLQLPDEFKKELQDLLRHYSQGETQIHEHHAQSLCGKVGRLAQIVPEARPYASALYGALAGAIAARSAGAREASPGHFPMKRFHHAAAWIWTLLVDNEASPIDLVRLIHAGPEPQPRPAELRVQFDASTSGGGAVLLEDGIPVEWFAVTWDTQELWRGAPVAVGDSSWQTFWEFLTL